MNRNDFIRIVNDPSLIDRQMTGEVKELLDLFPWFHSAHLLFLKGLHNTGDVRFENQLRQSAIQIADREVLYYMLHNLVSAEPAESRKTTGAVPLLPDQPDNQQVVIESGKNSSELINALEKTSLTSVSPEQGPHGNEAASKETIIITSDSEIDESASVMLVFDDGDSHIEESVIFMDPSISSGQGEELLELEENAPELSDDKDTGLSGEANDQSKGESRKLIQSKLIDNFILLNPRIEASREKPEKTNEDLSTLFVEEKDAFITETLARIYINQSYYSRAIDIYEKLSLKFPEKSSYFATQIEKVKELIK